MVSVGCHPVCSLGYGGEEYGIPLSVVADESDKVLDFVQLERMFWEAPSVTMLPCGQS